MPEWKLVEVFSASSHPKHIQIIVQPRYMLWKKWEPFIFWYAWYHSGDSASPYLWTIHGQLRETTAEDYALATELVVLMQTFYNLEKEWQAKILKVLNISIKSRGVGLGDYTTDGKLSVGFLRYLIAEIKHEVRSTHQGILYHLESTGDQALRYLHYVLLCMIVSLFGALAVFFFTLTDVNAGPYISSAGVSWTDNPNVQTLSLTIPCHFHFHNDETKATLARPLEHVNAPFSHLRSTIKPCDPAY